jgi:hypothetical protein
MADEKQPERMVTPAERAQERQRQAAREVEGREGASDETVPGGRYQVADALVDAEGQPVKRKKDED